MKDPIAALLADFDDAVAPRPAFADELRARLVDELGHPRRRAVRSRRARALLIASGLALLLAGLATATYLLVRPHGAVRPKRGSLTVASSPGNGISKVLEILPRGRTRVVWHCPRPVFCGELTSVDWSPDGRRVAFTLDEIGGGSRYIGLHIVDIASGRDVHLPALPDSNKNIPLQRTRLGCEFPTQVAWAPDGKRLAYTCSIFNGDGARRSAIFTIGSDGIRHAQLPVARSGNVGWPAWAPDGKHIAFTAYLGSSARPAIYTAALDGSDRRRLALDGQAPAWSPDGRTIAYQASHGGGVRLVTPLGRDATPASGPVAPSGLPAWSPDGATLAVGTPHGTYLVDPAGAHLRRVTKLNGATPAFGFARPAWSPGHVRNVSRHLACSSCL